MLSAKRTLNPASTSVLSFDYKAKQAIAANSPTNHQFGGSNAPMLESYDPSGMYSYANSDEAQRYANLHQQAHEARNKIWQARSTVRTLRPGTRFTMMQSPIHAGETYTGDPLAPEYVVLSVRSIGINNLPKRAVESIAEALGDIPSLLADTLQQLTDTSNNSQTQHSRFNAQQGFAAPDVAQANNNPSLEHALNLGYANAFEAIRADITWRPVLNDDTGLRHNPKPTMLGSQSAIVVGASGDAEAAQENGADEIYCDRLGRIKVRFHWQDTMNTCWVRVVQRSAGSGMGWQFLPRIGQEVQVQFIEGDIDRPIIIGALYNGQGEGGVAPTPGGDTSQSANLTVYEEANDHQYSAQGNMVGGHSPAWHGASGDEQGHRNAAAITGIRSKEFGGFGYNQLALDDTDNQGRIQLKTTQQSTELNLGHLIHNADNYRGSFRGQGAELRTDAYGALRAGAGLLITSYQLTVHAQQRDFAGDNVAGMAHLKHAVQLSKNFSQAAGIHQTVQYSTHIGSYAANKSNLASSTKPAAPLQALYTAASGMVSQEGLGKARVDAQNKNTQVGEQSQPYSTDPVIHLVGKAGFNVTAGQHLQLANAETTTVMSGEDTQLITGEQFRLHTGQAIGLLGGAVNADIGLQLITAKDDTHVQAQSDDILIQAQNQVNIMSANAHIDWAAAKSISMSTKEGANITIEGGNITVQCPEEITIHARQVRFVDGEETKYKLPIMPRGALKPADLEFRLVDPWGRPVSNASYKATLSDGTIKRGLLDEAGYARIDNVPLASSAKVEILRDERPLASEVTAEVDPDWDAFLTLSADDLGDEEGSA